MIKFKHNTDIMTVHYTCIIIIQLKQKSLIKQFMDFQENT